jgi:Na+-driven multidrug efflux pump
MVPMGISIWTTTRMGTLLGEGDVPLAKRIAAASLAFGALVVNASPPPPAARASR